MNSIKGTIELDISDLITNINQASKLTEKLKQNLNNDISVKTGSAGTDKLKSSLNAVSESAKKLKKDITETSTATGKAGSGFGKMNNDLNKTADTVEKTSSKFSAFKQNLLSFAGGSLLAGGLQGIISGVANVGKSMIQGNIEMEQYQVQLSTLLGSTEQAKQRLKELDEFGASTPFEVTELIEAEKVLLGFGFNTEKTMFLAGKTFEQFRTIVGDVSAGTGANFNEIALLFGKFGSGATGEAISRMQELGIATREQMKEMGIQFDSAGTLISPLPKAFDVAVKLASEKFGGGMKALSSTAGGLLSTLSDNVSLTLRNIGKPLFESFKPLVENLVNLFQSSGFQTIVSGITGSISFLISTVAGLTGIISRNIGTVTAMVTAMTGLYVILNAVTIKTMLLAKWTLIKSTYEKIAQAVTSAYTTVQTLLNVAMNTNPILLIVTGIGLLIGAVILAYNEVEVFRNIIDTAFKYIKAGVMIVYTIIKTYFVTGFEIIKTIVSGIAGTVKALFSGDFSGAFDNVKKLGNDLAGVVKNNVGGAIDEVNGYLAETKEKQADVNKETQKQETAIQKAVRKQQELTAEIKNSLTVVSDLTKQFNNAFSSSVNEIKQFKTVKALTEKQYKFLYDKADEKQKVDLEKIRNAGNEQLEILEKNAKTELDLARQIAKTNEQVDEQYKVKQDKKKKTTNKELLEQEKQARTELNDLIAVLDDERINNQIKALEQQSKEIEQNEVLTAKEKAEKLYSIQQDLTNANLQKELKAIDDSYNEQAQKEIDNYNKTKVKTAEFTELHNQKLTQLALIRTEKENQIYKEFSDNYEISYEQHQKKLNEIAVSEKTKSLENQINLIKAYSNAELEQVYQLEKDKLQLEYETVLAKQSLTDDELARRIEYDKKLKELDDKLADDKLNNIADVNKKEFQLALKSLNDVYDEQVKIHKNNNKKLLELSEQYEQDKYDLSMKYLSDTIPAIKQTLATVDDIKKIYDNKDKAKNDEQVKKLDDELKKETELLEKKLKNREITYKEFSEQSDELAKKRAEKEKAIEQDKTTFIMNLNKSLIASFNNLAKDNEKNIDKMIKKVSSGLIQFKKDSDDNVTGIGVSFKNFGNNIAELGEVVSTSAISSFSAMVTEGVPVLQAFNKAVLGTVIDTAEKMVLSNIPAIFTFLSALIPPPFGQIVAGGIIATGVSMLEYAKSKISGAETGYLPGVKEPGSKKGATDNRLIWFNDTESIVPADVTKSETPLLTALIKNRQSSKEYFEQNYLPAVLSQHKIQMMNSNRNKHFTVPGSVVSGGSGGSGTRNINVTTKSAVEIEMKPMKLKSSDLLTAVERIRKKELKRF